MTPTSTLRQVLLPALFALAATPAAANDFPTLDRVLFVQECMRENPGQYYEMVSKCACALDALASEVSYDDYMKMNTSSLANSIGGERGSYIRSNDALRGEIRRLREVRARVFKGCFIGVGPSGS
jgi:hypothetical protein